MQQMHNNGSLSADVGYIYNNWKLLTIVKALQI
jgi:hypothetical protein